MNEVIVSSLQYLTNDDAQAMGLYISSLSPLNDIPPAKASADVMSGGRAVYLEHCERCHLSSGRGAFLKAPPVVGSAVVQGRDAASLINVILHGAQVGAVAKVPFGAWEDMPTFADKLSDTQVAVVSTYLRSSWDNKGSSVTAADVKRQR